jgi:hypothetical protein
MIMQVEKNVIALTAVTQTDTEYTRALHSLPKNAPLQPTHPLSTPTMVEKTLVLLIHPMRIVNPTMNGQIWTT